jgi:hypothetical protein
VELKNKGPFSIQQTDLHLQQLKKHFQKKVVLILENVESYNRKRLIEKHINFIVPNKQLYLPELLIDLKESYPLAKTKLQSPNLLPSAQFLFIYHLLHCTASTSIEGIAFKDIAKRLDYTPMAITNAIENLVQHELVRVTGDKEKAIHFQKDRAALWHTALQKNRVQSPVIKTVFVDQKPKGVALLKTNASALPAYSDLNPSAQAYYAIEKNAFYDLQKNDALLNLNESEGKFALEVWKYDPNRLIKEKSNDLKVVDPFSLYLSLKDSKDERVEMALEQIIERFVW